LRSGGGLQLSDGVSSSNRGWGSGEDSRRMIERSCERECGEARNGCILNM